VNEKLICGNEEKVIPYFWGYKKEMKNKSMKLKKEKEVESDLNLCLKQKLFFFRMNTEL
jgi:hypothetical protein